MKIFDFYINDNETSIFLRYYVNASIGSIRLAVWVATLVVSAFAILDFFVASSVALEIIAIRFGVIIPVLATTYWLTFIRNFVRYSQLILFLAGLALGLSFVCINHLIPRPELATYFYFANIIFCVIWVHTLLRLKAELAMIVSGITIIAFNIESLLLRPLPSDATMFNAILCIDAFLMAMYLLGIWASNLTERMLWRDFEQASIIKSEKQTIEQSQKQLMEINRLKGKLLSIISHDIRGPISSIRGLLTLYTAGHISQEEMTQSLVKLNKSIGSTTHLIDNLLSWSLSQLESREILKKTVSFRTMVENVFEVVRTQAEAKNIVLINSIDKSFEAEVEPTMIELVIRNLVTNSIKFTHSGVVEVKAHKDKEKIQVSVEDSGTGISKDVANGLFKWNERKSSNGTNLEKGSGLGLLICKEFVEKHGGTLSFDSERNVGASFHFTIEENASC